MRNWAAEIEEELDWREAELASLKMAIVFARSASARSTALRAAWALLYAHYEGFCQFVWDFYLDAVQEMKPLRSQCNDALATLSLSQDFKHLKHNASEEAFWTYMNLVLQSRMAQPIEFSTRIEAESNLDPELLITCCQRAGLPCRTAKEHQPELALLVKRRNKIAHGENVTVRDVNEYTKYEDVVKLVMHELAISVIDRLETRGYRKRVSLA